MSVAEQIGQGKYVSLTTYKKDGTAVATPVWHAYVDGEVLIISEADAWKVKRIRNNPQVQVTVCGVRGGVKPDAPSAPGTARLLDEAGTQAARRAIARKYLLSRLGNWVTKTFRMKRPPVIGIAVSL